MEQADRVDLVTPVSPEHGSILAENSAKLRDAARELRKPKLPAPPGEIGTPPADPQWILEAMEAEPA